MIPLTTYRLICRIYSMNTSTLERAIRIAGSQSALARAAGIRQQDIWYYLNRANGRVPAEKCAAIEKATGGRVTCRDLRPDVFRPDQAQAEERAA